MMMHDDTLFDQRVHDAYERIELSEEAQDDMLGRLLAAQRERERVSQDELDATIVRPVAPVVAPEDAGRQDEREGKVTPFAPRRTIWRRVLPLAAVLAVAFVVVQVAGLARLATAPRMADSAVQEKALEAAATDEGTSDDAVAAGSSNEVPTGGTIEPDESAEPLAAVPESSFDGAIADASDLAEGGEAVTETAPLLAETHPLILLEDGTQLTTLLDGSQVVEADEGLVGSPLGEATAVAADADGQQSGVSCWVYALADDDAAFVVRYEGEDHYWRCEPVG